jgi:hypothetical protein
MPTVYKNAQVQGTAGLDTYSTLYNTGAGTTAVISSILVTNTAGSAASYRIGIMGSAGTPAANQWIAFGIPIAANDTIALTLGITLGNSQFIRVSSSANTVTFSAYISEIS